MDSGAPAIRKSTGSPPTRRALSLGQIANPEIKLDIKGDKGYVALCRNGNPWQVVSDTLEIADLPEGLLEFIAAKAEAAKAAKEKTREGIAKEVKRELKKYPVREMDLSPDELEQYKKYVASALKGEAESLASTKKDVESRNEAQHFLEIWEPCYSRACNGFTIGPALA